MDAIFSLLEEGVFFGDMLTQREFVSLMSPGQFVSTNLSPNNLEDLYTQWEITNDRLDTSFLRRPLNGTITGLFSEILEFKALPKKELEQEKKDRLNEIKGEIRRIKSSYRKYEEIYNEVDREYRREMNKENPDPILVVDLRKKRNRASQDWEDDGHKKDYELLKSEENYLVSGDPRAYWKGEIEDPFKNQELEGVKGKFYPTYFEPRVDQWEGSSWENKKLGVKSDHRYSYSRSTSWSGGFGAGWGLWHFGGRGGRSETYRHTTSQVTEVNIEFDVLRVRIQRPWLHTDIFNYRFWTWRDTHGWLQISDGGKLNQNPPVRPIGERGLPFLQKEMYVIRNLTIKGNFSHEDETHITTNISGSAGFGWGPFSISGSYRESTEEKIFKGEYSNGTITVKQPQIIAFGGTLIPKCPDPDRGLPWESDAVFEEHISENDLKMNNLIKKQDYQAIQIANLYQNELSSLRKKSAIEANAILEAIEKDNQKKISEIKGALDLLHEKAERQK